MNDSLSSPQNRRQDYRAPVDLQATLAGYQRKLQAHVLNLSAGGALIETTAHLPAGSRVALDLQIPGNLQAAANVPSMVEVIVEVIGQNMHAHTPPGIFQYRCKSLARASSQETQTLRRIVTAAQREEIAARSSMADASPMQTSLQRRQARRRPWAERFSKSSLRSFFSDE